LGEHCNFLLWQPAWAGRTVLHQFLRLQLAAHLVNGAPPAAPESLREKLALGHAVEVTGYTLSPELALGLDRAVLNAPSPGVHTHRVAWFEVAAMPQPRLSAIPDTLRAAWCHPGVQLVRHAISGPAFWQGNSVEEVPQLLAATTAALTSPRL
jgi:hypothetical protein